MSQAGETMQSLDDYAPGRISAVFATYRNARVRHATTLRSVGIGLFL
jgi:hypothetical protein